MLSILKKTVLTLKKSIRSNPLSEKLLALEYEKRFATAKSANLFRGVFSDYGQALSSAPAGKPIGYDHPEPANMYRDRAGKVYPSDYPVLFWLSQIMKANEKVFDYGGHVGVSFYAYRHYLDYNTLSQWTVCDVPAVVTAGQKLAEENAETQLSFTTDFNNASDANILFASGSLQYLDLDFAEQISQLENQPSHLIINLLPAYDGEAFFTLQNIGTAFCPYKIVNIVQFKQSLEKIGYSVEDQWTNPEKNCYIPYEPEHSLKCYYGFYFRKQI